MRVPRLPCWCVKIEEDGEEPALATLPTAALALVDRGCVISEYR